MIPSHSIEIEIKKKLFGKISLMKGTDLKRCTETLARQWAFAKQWIDCTTRTTMWKNSI